jgi:hypothetical protein
MVSLSLTYLPHGEEHIILLDGFFFLLLEFDFQQSSTCSSYYECYWFDSVWSTLVGV